MLNKSTLRQQEMCHILPFLFFFFYMCFLLCPSKFDILSSMSELWHSGKVDIIITPV